MKRNKRAWTSTVEQKRKDNFNWKPFSIFDFWEMSNSPVYYDHRGRRAKERQNISRIKLGYDESELHWPTKWQRCPDYW